MKKLLLAVIISSGIALGGCAQLSNLETGISLATKSITNPVTINDEYAIESSVRIGVAALAAYKKACAADAADKACRANVAAIQVYTRQMSPLLAQLRSFVKNNDQINATIIYNQLVTLYTNFKTAAVNVGVKVGA